MRLLLDTHILVWAVAESRKISANGRAFLAILQNTLLFSAVNLWEVAIKTALARDEFRFDVGRLLQKLLDNGYAEVAVTGAHAAALAALPPVHKDPFDRMLVAQATVEDLTLITADPIVAGYPGPIRLV